MREDLSPGVPGLRFRGSGSWKHHEADEGDDESSTNRHGVGPVGLSHVQQSATVVS